MKKALKNVEEKIKLLESELNELEMQIIANNMGCRNLSKENILTLRNSFTKDIVTNIYLIKSIKKFIVLLTILMTIITLISPINPIILGLATALLNITSLKKLNKIENRLLNELEGKLSLKYNLNPKGLCNFKASKELKDEKDSKRERIEELKKLRQEIQVRTSYENEKIMQLKK